MGFLHFIEKGVCFLEFWFLGCSCVCVLVLLEGVEDEQVRERGGVDDELKTKEYMFAYIQIICMCVCIF